MEMNIKTEDMDDATRESFELAWRLQAEEDARVAEQQAAATRLQDEPEDAESLALAIRLQQEDDEQALRNAMGETEEEGGDLSPSQYSYEQLMRLGQTIGEVSRGASAEHICALRCMGYEEARKDSSIILGEQCSICRMEFEPSDELRVMRCGHAEHAECLDQWLAVNKSCPLCHKEIVPSPPCAPAPSSEPTEVFEEQMVADEKMDVESTFESPPPRAVASSPPPRAVAA